MQRTPCYNRNMTTTHTATVNGKTLTLEVVQGDDIVGPAGEALSMWYVFAASTGALLGGGSEAQAKAEAKAAIRKFVKTNGVAFSAHAI